MGDEMSVWMTAMGMNARVCESSGLGSECMGGSQWETKRVFEGAVMGVNSERSGVGMGSECIGGPQRA